MALLLLPLAACTGSGAVGPTVQPAGGPESARTSALATAASAVQRDAPTANLDVYLVGFHPMKDDPSHQFEAHHFCHVANEDLMQCALFDGNTRSANLTGIEYIISERLFGQLPRQERQYWHPHNGEILSGQLVAPGIPAAAEHALMASKMNSYGKTWHTWDVSAGGVQGGSLPLGPPRLAWSFSREGEARPGLVAARDRRMGIDTVERRRARQDLVPLAHPQAGVDALRGRFGRPTLPIPGVVDAGAGSLARSGSPASSER
ncbi:OBAP family protein [Roseomonas sp. E05]|uniref:OBAP family protein n=1 Tax=Roseomonas sp. E05 TaxID=3046310 RepID=UPI0024B8BC3E|nr:OBAP family protein [Roseomonas sp. E05]MDJ0391025.1 OBAP family protein [Roseomonas sp. E05]